MKRILSVCLALVCIGVLLCACETQIVTLKENSKEYQDVSRVAEGIVRSRTFRPTVTDRITYDKNDKTYHVELSELSWNEDETREEAIKRHRAEYDGNSRICVCIRLQKTEDSADWYVLSVTGLNDKEDSGALTETE